MGFSRQECWSGLPFPSPEDLPNPGIKPETPALAGRFFTIAPPGKPYSLVKVKVKSQSCLTLCDSMDCNPPDSSVHGIFQARYWSGLPFPSPGDLPNPRIEPQSPAL